MGVGSQCNAKAALLEAEWTCEPIRRGAEYFASTGFKPQTVQTAASHYIDYTSPASWLWWTWHCNANFKNQVRRSGKQVNSSQREISNNLQTSIRNNDFKIYSWPEVFITCAFRVWPYIMFQLFSIFNFKLFHLSCVLNNQHSMHNHRSRQPVYIIYLLLFSYVLQFSTIWKPQITKYNLETSDYNTKLLHWCLPNKQQKENIRDKPLL